jgi:hypothetical protein
MPGFPGAAWSSSQAGLCASLQASACSRAPLPTRAGADEADLDVEFACDEVDVRARRVGQPVQVFDPVQRLGPAGERLVDRLGVVEVALVGGKLLRLEAVRQAVSRADRQLVERGQDVELRQRQGGEPVQPRRVSERDEVEPAAAADATGHRPELTTEVADSLLVRPVDLGRERALTDARHVRLRNPEHRVDPRRADAETGRRPACERA